MIKILQRLLVIMKLITTFLDYIFRNWWIIKPNSWVHSKDRDDRRWQDYVIQIVDVLSNWLCISKESMRESTKKKFRSELLIVNECWMDQTDDFEVVELNKTDILFMIIRLVPPAMTLCSYEGDKHWTFISTSQWQFIVERGSEITSRSGMYDVRMGRWRGEEEKRRRVERR
jgi:hypothetical protein